MIRPYAPLAALALLAGCSSGDDLRPFAVVRRADVWQAVIKDGDRDRLSRLSDAWEQAQANIASAGRTADLAALGLVAQREVTATPVFPTAGAYQCRTILMGWRQGSAPISPPLQVGEWAPCTLSADGILLRLETAPGPQQFLGTLYPDVDRLIFLGSVRLAGEMGRLRYGEDQARDQLGVLQAVGPAQWRVAMPWPRWTGRLVLIDIRPNPA